MFIATLIAAGRLDERQIDQALTRVAGATFLQWIDEGDAADLQVPDLTTARRALEGWQDCDVIIQSAESRAKKLFVADMDSTMIGQECIDELASYAGVKDLVAAVTGRAMQGELDFEQALRERVALLEGTSVSAIEDCIESRISPNAGASTLVRTLNAYGVTTTLVSGGFDDFVDHVSKKLGFKHYFANRLSRENGRLTGNVEGKIVDGSTKKDTLIEQRERLGLAAHEVMAIGDGANDLAMVVEAGLGIAYRAKPVLAEAADVRLDHNDLDAILWGLGIPRRNWVVD